MHNQSTPTPPSNGALALLSSHRPRNVGWREAAALLFGDWGTSRLYALGLAFFFAGPTSLYLVAAMSLLILAVGWAYTHICRIFPDGGGVYSAAKRSSQLLGVIGALLLFADYVVTASLSSLDAFHYFGLSHGSGKLFAWASPGLWAIVSIIAIGCFNFLGPKHTSGFALIAAGGMIFITVLIAAFALPQVDWSALPQRIGGLLRSPESFTDLLRQSGGLWLNFVAIVLALSGVEAIGNLTGVMTKPVAKTSRRAIWVVAIEVAIFNVLLCLCIVSVVSPEQRSEHKEDMLAFLAATYAGPWAEIAVRAIGGVLLLSAANTVISGMISVLYLMSRDGELPVVFQRLNRFGVPWVGAVIATSVPALVLVASHDLEHLAALYAIGVVGAVAINITLCARHPRLHGLQRRLPMLLLGIFLIVIWITLAATKLHALAFVVIVLSVGLIARLATRLYARRHPKPSLLQQATYEQLSPEALALPKVLLATYGSTALAEAALAHARQRGAALVVCFVREVALSQRHGADTRFRAETDLAAQRTFTFFLEAGHRAGVPIYPVYDAGPNAAELMAEHAAVLGCHEILVGTTRRGPLHQLLKGNFVRNLERLLPPEIPVTVLASPESAATVPSAPLPQAELPAPT
jgi:amino acid transporter/nucleotide-binding universal stress UspA family protein